METDTTTFDFSNVPASFLMCFLGDCPRRSDCLHFLAGEHLAEDADWGPAVYHTMKRGEEGCRFFKTSEPKLMAWGFNTIFEDVKAKHETKLRDKIKIYLGGHGTYYRYHRGEKMLTPEQQAWIIKLFQKAGYETNLKFDHYTRVYDFDH